MSAAVPAPDFQFRLLEWQPVPPKPRLLPEPPPVERDGETGESNAVKQLRASLETAIAAKLMNGSQLIRALAKERREEQLPTMLIPFDTLLGGGLARGRMTELSGRGAIGRFAVVLAALASATSAGEAAVLVDLGDHFDPQLAEAAGIDLRRLLWIRPQTLKQAVMSVEMITATGFQLVALDAGLYPVRGRRVPDAAWVRLARSAEAHGAAMLISTPYPLTGTASEAVVAARRGRVLWRGTGKAPRVLAGVAVELTLEKHRHLRPGKQATLMLQSIDAIARPDAPNSAPATVNRQPFTPNSTQTTDHRPQTTPARPQTT
ncbi:MAG: hypothetical protein ABI837_02230 [Acidobacteriota bacterium]